MIRHPTHKTSIQVLFMATVLFLLTLQDGTTICLHCDLQVVHISCSFLCLFYVNVLFQINANNILRPSCYCILYSWIPTTWIRLSIYHSDTDPERTRAPAARDRPGGSSIYSYPPTLFLSQTWPGDARQVRTRRTTSTGADTQVCTCDPLAVKCKGTVFNR